MANAQLGLKSWKERAGQAPRSLVPPPLVAPPPSPFPCILPVGNGKEVRGRMAVLSVRLELLAGNADSKRRKATATATATHHLNTRPFVPGKRRDAASMNMITRT